MYLVDKEILERYNNRLTTLVDGSPVSLSGEDIVITTTTVTGCCGGEKITEETKTVPGVTQKQLKKLYEMQNGKPGKVLYVPDTDEKKTNKRNKRKSNSEGETE